MQCAAVSMAVQQSVHIATQGHIAKQCADVSVAVQQSVHIATQ
jgi:hypothetical protein